MKTLLLFICDTNITESFNEIDSEIINESLLDNKLLTIAKSLKGLKAKRYSFASVLGYFDVAWDKVKESDWDEYTDIQTAKKVIRKIITNKQNYIHGIALLENNGKIFAMVTPVGHIIEFYVSSYILGSEYPVKIPKNVKIDKQSTTLNYVEELADKVYVLDIDKNNLGIRAKRNDRFHAKQDMVLQGDDEYYAKLARQNVERYEKLIAKKLVEQNAKNDTIVTDIQAIVYDIMDLCTKVSNDPKYADIAFDVRKLNYDLYTYSTFNNRTGEKIGKNGLLILLNTYLEYKTNIAKDGGYSYMRKNLKNISNEISDLIKYMKEKINNIKSKL